MTQLTRQLQNENLNEGWWEANETWTYASSTSFTVSGDVTSKYQKGDKIRLKQGGGWKYFYIVGVSYSAPNTTITITGGDDYSLANATITDNYYSRVERPLGFPSYFNYTPSHTGSNITLSGKFIINGSECITYIHGDITGTPTFGNIGLPVVSNAIGGFGVGDATDTGSLVYHGYMYSIFTSASTFALSVIKSTSGGGPTVNSTTPFTWASGDRFNIKLVYAI